MGEAYIVGGMLAMFPLAFLYRWVGLSSGRETQISYFLVEAWKWRCFKLCWNDTFRRFVYSLAPSHKDLFFTLTGLLTVLLCFGSSSLHLLISLMMCYAVMLLLGNNRCAVCLCVSMSVCSQTSISSNLFSQIPKAIYCRSTGNLVRSSGVSKVSCAVIFLSTMSHLLWGYVRYSLYTVFTLSLVLQ